MKDPKTTLMDALQTVGIYKHDYEELTGYSEQSIQDAKVDYKEVLELPDGTRVNLENVMLVCKVIDLLSRAKPSTKAWKQAQYYTVANNKPLILKYGQYAALIAPYAER